MAVVSLLNLLREARRGDIRRDEERGESGEERRGLLDGHGDWRFLGGEWWWSERGWW